MKIIQTTCYNRNQIAPIEKTAIDKRKEQSNRLISICGKYHTVILSSGEMMEFSNKRSFSKWAESNDYVTDF